MGRQIAHMMSADRHTIVEKNLNVIGNVKKRSDITPDPGGHRPQRPCAQGRTCAKQDQAQASALGQNRIQLGGGATTHGRRTKQAGKSVPTKTRPGAGGCKPQTTPSEGTLQQDPNTLASCAKGTYGPGQPQGRAGTGQHKPWQQQRGYDWSETTPATPPPRGPTQSTPGRGHTGEGQVQQSRPGPGYTGIQTADVQCGAICVP